MVLVGAAIMPHGALILDPGLAEIRADPALAAAVTALHEGCGAAAEMAAGCRPDLVLLYTPHGLISEGADASICALRRCVAPRRARCIQ